MIKFVATATGLWLQIKNNRFASVVRTLRKWTRQEPRLE